MNTYPQDQASQYDDPHRIDEISPPKSTSNIGWICVWLQLAMLVVEIGLIILGSATSKGLFDWMYPFMIAMAIDGLRHVVAIVGIYFGISDLYESPRDNSGTTKNSKSRFPRNLVINLGLLLFPYAAILINNVWEIFTLLFPMAG